MCKNDALNLIEEIIQKVSGFLLQNQVHVPAIILNSSSKKNRKQIIQIGIQDYTIYYRFNEGRWQWSNNNSTFHEIPIATVFPIYFDNSCLNKSREKKEQITLFGRFSTYIFRYGLSTRVIRKLADIFSFPRIVDRFKYKKEHIDKSMSKVGGLRFIAEKDGAEIKLSCTDNGGIFDSNLNTQEEEYPAQVPLGYYSTEYAIYVFFFNWLNTREQVWKQALERGIDFFILNHKPKTAIAFDHYEFKALPISLMLYELISTEDANISKTKITALKKSLSDKWFSYQPVNVFALRLANSAIFNNIGVSYSKIKINKALKMISKHQTDQGLIMDNIGGASIASADLTYHQFSLACLMVAYKFGDFQELENVIKKALAFSNYILLSDSHINYYGRGANNIYHIASYIYALSCTDKPDYKTIAAVMKRFLSFFKSHSGLPSALNSHQEKRMGWNHCSVPYQGQSLFFLILCYKNLLKKGDQKLMKSIAPNTNQKNIDYYKLSNNFFECVISRGADSYAWSNGGYASGVAGIAGLSVNNEFISLTPCFSLRDKAMICDIPHFDSVDKLRPFIMKAMNNGCELRSNYLDVKYFLDNGSLEALYIIKADGVNHGGLPIQDSISVLKKGAEIILNVRNHSMVKLLFYHNEKLVEVENEEIHFNPYGTGRLLKPNLTLRKGDRIKMILTKVK